MDWTIIDFSGITSGVLSILPVVFPVALGLFALYLAISISRDILDDSVYDNARRVRDEYDDIVKRL